ncbi:ATP-binding cassette sub-family G member 1-like [Oppia nitens]|uniref:ATP-binding cassette sub-family G member 1-like n=1 Tax=Oppia nitens TaxID=1686743 RepID=UPI0023DBBBF1|nr:ATP-binding cassette sub-family G member 1-like [Oppia nitens]
MKHPVMCDNNNNTAIVWRDLTASVNQWRGSSKVILRHISGSFDFGTITGLMGASGSGKTTLIKCLNSSNKYVINDKYRLYCSKSQPIVKRCLTQVDSDRLIDVLTVGEALSYSSKVNNSCHKSVKHDQNITQLMKQLLINNIKNTPIGKCSGGQRKRIAIALQLTSIEKPNLLFMDEPTTGLDSTAALELLKCLKSFVKTHNIAVIISIHQPNNDLIQMFDNIYVLAKGGDNIYEGSPQQMKHFMIDCQIYFNENKVVIEVMLKISSQGIHSPNAMKLSEKIRQINANKCDKYLKHMKQTPTGIQSIQKSFSFLDFWHIFHRSLNIMFFKQRMKLMRQLLVLFLFNMLFALPFSRRIGQVIGCLESIGNQTCLDWQTDKKVLAQSVDYLHPSFIGSFLSRFGKVYKSISILNNISGSIERQSLMALMGPSGAGKTTLLKCLNAKYLDQLSNNSAIYSRFALNSKISFIKQNISEHLLSGLTVKQTLLYASKLKNSQIGGQLDHQKLVSDLMSEMLINDIFDNYVDKCSGGERKRIVIASELISCKKPNLMFIDEPTSGLDSNSALKVILCLKSLVRCHHMTIIASIHQPNNELYNIFDNIYVLAKGGQAIYEGSPQQLKQTLIETNINCDDNEVPIELLLRIASDDTDNQSMDKLCLKQKLQQKSLNDRIISENMKPFQTNQLKSKRFYIKDVLILLKRTMLYTYIANWQIFLIEAIFYQLFGVSLIALFNWQMIEPDGCLEMDISMTNGCNKTLSEIRNEALITSNVKYNNMIGYSFTMIILVVTSASFCADITVFNSEHYNGWYSSGAYFWSKSICDSLPIMVYLLPFCWLINLYGTASMFAVYYLTTVFSALSAQSWAQISAIIFRKDTKVSQTFAITVFFMACLLCNTIVPLQDLHYSLQLLSNFAYLKYSYESVILAIYGFGRCSDNDINTVFAKVSDNNKS